MCKNVFTDKWDTIFAISYDLMASHNEEYK